MDTAELPNSKTEHNLQIRAQQEHTTTATEQSTTRRHTNRSGVHARTEELEEGAQGRRPRPPTDDSVRKRKAARVDGAATGCAGGWCTDSLDERPGSASVKMRADDDDTRMARRRAELMMRQQAADHNDRDNDE
ncbi:unnamed protein product [Miscanthus lutarioriparius]|uniref:Uncharacterized protein n=1 Tax=Miscanthus lutarioriparius TaxID=422564 RepID=A0A811QFW8_9POAL|nr:unnamed protein product [Miscanthus lutarioriparius]